MNLAQQGAAGDRLGIVAGYLKKDMTLEAASEQFDLVLSDQSRTRQRTDQRPAVAFNIGFVLERGGEFHIGNKAARIGCQNADARVELDAATLLLVLRKCR